MSKVSRLRNPKRPTPVSGRPRQFGKRTSLPSFDFTAFATQCHEANKGPKRHQGGTFGGCTKRVRAQRQREREAHQAVAEL